MFTVSVLCLAALCSLHSTAEAAVTGWTNPLITGAASGSGSSTQNIPESQAVGATPVTIVATAAGAKTYAIASQPTTGKLTISSTTGLLSLATGSFDYETATKYIVVITCTDAGDNTVGTATVTLSITDANDNSPVFVATQYRITMTDGAAAGSDLVTVKATDVDTVGAITYTITAGNTNNVFDIHSTSGAITVATGKTVDLAGTGGYTLTVTASDTINTGKTTVLVADKTCSGTTAIVASGMTVFIAMTFLML